jgi:methyl-accepting chemotaxis protein
MADAFRKVTEGRTGLEKLLDVIPGWGGYQERQNRRKADQVMRQVLAEKIMEQRRRLDTAQKDLIRYGRIDLVDDLGSAVTQLQTFADRVRTASYGYAGLFDPVRIRQAELEQIYNFDAALFEYVERMDVANDRLQEVIASGEGLSETIDIIVGIAREANQTFTDREHMILETPGAGE